MAPHKIYLPPGFRFHPTDVELVWYYLKRKVMGKRFQFEAISEVELYKFAPSDLPDKSCLRSNDLEWYFFCPRDRKYSHGSRSNRTTKTGFWKTTGRDRSIVHNSQTVGMKKTLIFYLGKPPQGSRTNWVMYEFRLESKDLANAGYQQDAYVLCKLFEKSGAGPKTGEQYGAPFKEEDWEDETYKFYPIPLPSIALSEPSSIDGNFEVGEPSCLRKLSAVHELSSTQTLDEIGEPSSIRQLSAVGEPSSMQYEPQVEPSSMLDHSGAGEVSSMQVAEPSNVAEPSPDWFSLEQLQEFLNCSPPHSISNYDKILDAGILLEDIIQGSDPDFQNQNIYGDLDDLSILPVPEQATYENILPDSITMGSDLHPALAGFAREHYVEIGNVGFAGDGNSMELVVPGYHGHPFSNDNSSHQLNDVYCNSVSDTYLVSPSQIAGAAISHDQLPPPSEVHQLLSRRAREG